MRLLLFDIDGTLLQVNDAGRRAVAQALTRVVERPISTSGVSFSGRTDLDILKEILSKNDVPVAPHLQDALATYEEVAAEMLSPSDIEVLPGVRRFLQGLHDHEAVQLGLLTGNVEAVAFQKLAAANLSEYFSFGAFGSECTNRSDLPALALDRARVHTGRAYSPERISIIGDTPHDIHCAQSVGAHSVAVCTGRFSTAELARHDPDLLFESFQHPQMCIRRILSGLSPKSERCM